MKKTTQYFLAVGYMFITIIKTLLLLCMQLTKPIIKKTADIHDNTFDIVCVSHVGWSNVWQRNHHTMYKLSKRHKVIYCNPRPFWLNNIEKISGSLNTHREDQINDSLFVIYPLIFPGEMRFPFIRRINKLILIAVLRDKIEKIRIKKFVLWFYSPTHEYLAGGINEILTVYDIQDEYAAFYWMPKDTAKREMELLKKTDLVFTGTHSLYETKGKNHSNIHFIPCGVDVEHFKKARDYSLPLPQDIRDVPHPIIGYFGMVGGRLDTELLEFMSTRHPEWSIVLIGEHVKRDFVLKPKSNVYLLGKKNYLDLPMYLQAFDICMIPFRLNEITMNVNPTKLLEYLAAAKPVISTSIPDMIKFYGDVIEIADNKREFVRITEKLIREGSSEKIAKGIEMAEGCDWQATIDQMEYLIISCLRRKYDI